MLNTSCLVGSKCGSRMVSSLAGRGRVACDSQELAELEGSSLNGHLGESASPVELFVSGRLAVFGEHSDWAGAMRRCGMH